MHSDPKGCYVTISITDEINQDATQGGIAVSIDMEGGDPNTSAAARIAYILRRVVLEDSDIMATIGRTYFDKRHPKPSNTQDK